MSDERDDHLQNQDLKLEDILKSIRGVIDNHSNSLKTEGVTSPKLSKEVKEEQILELTKVFNPTDYSFNIKKENRLLSDEAKKESISKIQEFTNKIDMKGYSLDTNNNTMDNITLNIMKPLIKEWMDNNLPKMVEKVISEEIKQLIPKKN